MRAPQRLIRRVLVACALLGTFVTIPAQDSAAAPTPAIGFQFAPRQRLYDTREPGGALTAGVSITLTYGSPRTIVNMIAFSATEPTWFHLHPCGQPVDRTRPAVIYLEPGDFIANLVPVDTSSPCLTMFGKSELIIDWVGTQSPTPGLSYVEHPQSVELPVSVPTVAGAEIRVPARAGVPAGAEAVLVAVTVARSTAPVTLIECDQPGGQWVVAPNDGSFASNLMILPIAVDGTICLDWLGDAPPDAVFVDRLGYLATGVDPFQADPIPYRGYALQDAPGYVPVGPTRRFDTRDTGAPIAAGGTFRHDFGDLPLDASAVALTITATRTTGPGFVTAYPCDAAARPVASNVNITGAGQTVPNFAIVSLGTTAELCFFASAQTDVLVDLAGYYQFDGGDGYVQTEPRRVLDTRPGGRVDTGGTVEIDLSTAVASDATAVVLTVAATDPAAPGFLTVFPCGDPVPTASNVNYLTRETRANSVTVGVPASRRVCIYSSTDTDVIADLAGWYAPSSRVGLLDAEPFREFDTRDGGAPPLAARDEVQIGFDDPYLVGVAWNLTVTDTSGPGFITGYPCASGLPTTSNVNFTAAGQTVASFAILPVDAAGDVCVYTLTATHVIADSAGWFLEPFPSAVFLEGDPTV